MSWAASFCPWRNALWAARGFARCGGGPSCDTVTLASRLDVVNH